MRWIVFKQYNELWSFICNISVSISFTRSMLEDREVETHGKVSSTDFINGYSRRISCSIMRRKFSLVKICNSITSTVCRFVLDRWNISSHSPVANCVYGIQVIISCHCIVGFLERDIFHAIGFDAVWISAANYGENFHAPGAARGHHHHLYISSEENKSLVVTCESSLYLVYKSVLSGDSVARI